MTEVSCVFVQIEMFKKAGWTVVQPPTPVIPDGKFHAHTAVKIIKLYTFQSCLLSNIKRNKHKKLDRPVM